MEIAWLDKLLHEQNPSVQLPGSAFAALQEEKSKAASAMPSTRTARATTKTTRRPDADQGSGKKTYIDEDEINALFADMLIPEKELIAATKTTPAKTPISPRGASASTSNAIPMEAPAPDKVSLEYLKSQKESNDELWNLSRQGLYRVFKNSFNTSSLALLRANAVGVKELSVLRTVELLNLLKHRDEVLQEKAAAVLALRIAGAADAGEKEERAAEFVEAGGMRNFMALLGQTSRPMVIVESLKTLEALLEFTEYQELMRHIGGIKPLIRLLAISPDRSAQLVAINCLNHLCTSERNREHIAHAGGLRPILELVTNQEPVIKQRALLTLTKMTTNSEKIRTALLRIQGLRPFMPLLEAKQPEVVLQTYKLLAHLSLSPRSHTEFPKTFYASTLNMLNVRDVYQAGENTGPKHGVVEDTIVAIMSTIGNLCSAPANREIAAALQAVDRIVPFIVPSQGVAFDKFKWNLEALLAALRALSTLADLRENRVRMVELGVPSNVVRLLTTPDAFPRSMIGPAALLLFKVATSEEIHNAALETSVVALVRALKSKSYDQTLVLIVLRTLRYLAQDDRHKQKLEAEEALPMFLFHLESKNSDILAEAAELLLVLSAQPRLRQWVTAHALGRIFSLYSHPSLAVQLPVLQLLCLIAAEGGLKSLQLDNGAVSVLLTTLVAMLSSHKLQETALTMMDQVLCASEDNRECYMKIGTPACTSVLECITSHAEAVQQRTLIFLTHMAQFPKVKLALDSAGALAKLYSVLQNDNIRRDKLGMLQLYKAIILSFGSSFEVFMDKSVFGSGSKKKYRADDSLLAKIAARNPRELSEVINIIAQKYDIDLNEFLASASRPSSTTAVPSLAAIPAPPPGAGATPPTNISTSGAAPATGLNRSWATSLSPRNSPSPTPNARTDESLRVSTETVLRGGSRSPQRAETREVKDSVATPLPTGPTAGPGTPTNSIGHQPRVRTSILVGSAARGNATPTTPTPTPTPPPSSSSSAPTSSPLSTSPSTVSAALAASTNTPTSPRPSIQSTTTSAGSANNSAGSTSPRPLSQALANRSASPRPNSLQMGGERIQQETAGRKGPVAAKDLVEQKSRLKIVRKMLDQGVIEGKRYWESNVERWLRQFNTAVSADQNFLRIVFEMLEVQDSQMEFKRAAKLMSPGQLTLPQLAQHLLNLGFSLKRSIFHTDGKGEECVYEIIILPSDFPVRLLLKALILSTK